MAVTTFDTLAAARDLEAAGMDAAQAAAVVETVRVAATEGVATKADLDALEARMDAKLSSLEVRMTRMLYAIAAALLAGQVAAVLTLLRLLGN